jgi:hypothetical protein
VVSDFDDAVSKGDGDRVGPVKSPELANGGLDVLVDGSLRDMENFGDLPRGLAYARTSCSRGVSDEFPAFARPKVPPRERKALGTTLPTNPQARLGRSYPFAETQVSDPTRGLES